MQLKYTSFSSISMSRPSSSVRHFTDRENERSILDGRMRCASVRMLWGKEVNTPSIDRFAASGLLFQNAYCNIPEVELHAPAY